MDRSGKQAVIESLQQTLSSSDIILITHNLGLTVSQVTDLRRKMLAVGAGYKVTKNTLATLAFKGTRFEVGSSLLTGPTGIAYAKDPVSIAKIVVNFANANEKLAVVGGVMDGQLLNKDSIKTLASLPSLNELRGKIAALLNTPATRIATILQAPASQLARVVQAYANK
ncbi:MAG: 50S ribosomal protein L10 [Alphaproteobacteria bacterium]|nr:50S ribosomal protein L10 [Alphaproteobacteria bacterium]